MLASQVAQEEIVELAAMTAHNVNNALRAGLGETVKPAWQDCLPSFRKTVMQGVLGVIQGNGPEKSHESWTAAKAALGWTYGPVENEALKTHPCMVPYAQLPDAQKQKDTIFIATVKAVLAKGTPARVVDRCLGVRDPNFFSTGNLAVDELLGGGLRRGSCVLITGDQGGGKTRFATQWIDASGGAILGHGEPVKDALRSLVDSGKAEGPILVDERSLLLEDVAYLTRQAHEKNVCILAVIQERRISRLQEMMQIADVFLEFAPTGSSPFVSDATIRSMKNRWAGTGGEVVIKS